MGTVIRPSPKLRILVLAYIGLGGLTLGYGIFRENEILVLLAVAILVVTLMLLLFSMNTYVLAPDGLYHYRRLGGRTFVTWDKVGQVFLEQGFVEKRWDMGDLRIVGKDGRKLMRWRGVPQPERVVELIRNMFARYAFLHQLPERPEI